MTRRLRRNDPLDAGDVSMLQRMFKADTEAPDYWERRDLPGFDLHQKLGWPPWFPMMVEVWKYAEPPESSTPDVWARCRADVMRLFRQHGDSQ